MKSFYFQYQRGLLDEVALQMLYTASSKPIEERINFKNLDQYLKSGLVDNGIDLGYHFKVIDRDGREVYRCSDYVDEGSEYSYSQPLFLNDPPARMSIVKIHFPGKRDYIFDSINFMIPSMKFTFVLLITFIFTIYIVFRQKKLTEMKNDFINNMTHEFKTPIHSIKGMAEYLQHNEITREEEKEYLNVMAEEAGRLAQLSQNTLLLSKLDHMEVLRKKEEFRLDSQIRDCAILLMPSFEEKNIQLEAELPEMKFYGNEELMKEVWVNLLDNARKYSSEGNLVFVEGKVTQDDLWITVRDEGQGMDEQTKQHLFERYYQGDASHETSGFGMGLPIVKRIVELSGGTIWVESTLGKGTTVTIFLKLI